MMLLGMKTTTRLIIFLFSLTAYYTLFTTSVQAVCPVCTVAVGAGLGLARYAGVDDTVSGIWVGGLILSSSFWLSGWLKKQTSLPQLITSRLSLITIASMVALVFIPLWLTQTIGHPFNTIYGIDKLIFGTLVGTALFLLAMRLDKQVRKSKGSQLFIYQKVAFPVSALVLGSLSMYLLTR